MQKGSNDNQGAYDNEDDEDNAEHHIHHDHLILYQITNSSLSGDVKFDYFNINF